MFTLNLPLWVSMLLGKGSTLNLAKIECRHFDAPASPRFDNYWLFLCLFRGLHRLNVFLEHCKVLLDVVVGNGLRPPFLTPYLSRFELKFTALAVPEILDWLVLDRSSSVHTHGHGSSPCVLDLPDLINLVSFSIKHLLVLWLRFLRLGVRLFTFLALRLVVDAALQRFTLLHAGRLLVLSNAFELTHHTQRTLILLQHLVESVESWDGEVLGCLLLRDADALASTPDRAHLNFLVWLYALARHNAVQLHWRSPLSLSGRLLRILYGILLLLLRFLIVAIF